VWKGRLARLVLKDLVLSNARKRLARVRAEMKELRELTASLAASAIQKWYKTRMANRIPDAVRQTIIAAVVAEREQIAWEKASET
jgi:hypothetical protein